jgi:hypothetical protein
MKQHSLHHYICEVKLENLMETPELLGRLPVSINKLCGPCFLLCCACCSPFLSITSYDGSPVLQAAVQNSLPSVLVWSIRTTPSITSKLHRMPRRSASLLWKIPEAFIQFAERNWSYAMETRDVNTHLCGNQIIYLSLFFYFFKLIVRSWNQ